MIFSYNFGDRKTDEKLKIPDEKKTAYCSDFRYESNELFVLGVGFFFFRQISTF